MLSKLFNDSGVKYLIKNNKYVLLCILLFKFLLERLKKNKVSYNQNEDQVEVLFDKLPDIINLTIKPNSESQYKIEIVGHKLLLTKEIFEYNFSDQESLFSIYRFRWLLIGIEYYRDEGFVYQSIKVINHWIDNFDVIGKRVNETYSICERLLNILYFVSLVKHNNVKLYNKLNIQNLEKVFASQILDILENIEDNGKQTNNHILNNIRALYILGRLLEIKFISDLSHKLLLIHLKNHIKDGILNEGSFHYQILLTRTILEIYNTAQLTNDNNMINCIEQTANQMLFVTRSLHSDFSDTYPLIGDISPDFPVDFFQGYPFSKSDKNSKWNNLFNIRIENIEKHNVNNKYKYWEKFKFDDIEIWIVKKELGLLAHGHNDNSSFHIFFKGNAITHDIGRFTYNRNTMYDFMTQQSFHNGINRDIDLDKTSILFNHFRKKSSVNIKTLTNGIVVHIVDCFAKNEYFYKILIDNNKVSILSDENISLFLTDVKNIQNNSINMGEIEILLECDILYIKDNLASFNYRELTNVVEIEGISNVH